MKESTGGALLMGLAAGIIVIFIIIAAFFISYGKSFKLKNSIINKLEQSEGLSVDGIKAFLLNNSNRYKYTGNEFDICYNEFRSGNNDLVGFNYEIIVYMQTDGSILGKIKIPINGETRMIEKGNFKDDLAQGKKSGFPKMCSQGYEHVNIYGG